MIVVFLLVLRFITKLRFPSDTDKCHFMIFGEKKDKMKLHVGMPRGVLHNFQYGEVHANIWGPKFYVKSIFGVCELQHGQKFNVLRP